MKVIPLACVVVWISVLPGFGQLSAGASAVDITPTVFPVIQNGGFLEGQIHLATERLHARCLALDDGKTRLAMVVVDSCMIPRTLCDQVKMLASKSTGLATDKMLISATHCHSAPSVMNYCLGSRADPQYTAFIVPKIVEAIEQAVERLEPARAAWASVDAGEYTNNRRWITRADTMQNDPFGEKTVRAMMHPGYQSPNFVGPSGPKDPWLTFLSVQSAAGEPLALFGNFSMHYFGGHPGASPDFCGQFARQIEKRLAPDDPGFVGLLSQGTSGDLWWADYSKPKVDREIVGYTKALVDLVMTAQEKAVHRSDLSLAMAEKRMTLGRRLPDEKRLAWARELQKTMAGRRPKNRPEVYAEQAIYIHENPSEEIVLQAIRVGELGITAMPNEVYALTGLKLRVQSPLVTTFNIELANGAAGYIPPPEQHALGGYNTWPARTAGLEVEAEPKIVDGVLTLLEEVAMKKRRAYTEPSGAYARAVMESKPDIYWRLGDMDTAQVRDYSGHERHGVVSGNVALHLPGVTGPAFGGPYDSRATHFVGGVIKTSTENLPTDRHTLILWVWSGVSNDLLGESVHLAEIGETLGIIGKGEHIGKLFVSNQEALRLVGETRLPPEQWHQVALVQDGREVRVHLNGRGSPEIVGELPERRRNEGIIIGGAGLQGKLDEVAVYRRALSANEIVALYAAARSK